MLSFCKSMYHRMIALLDRAERAAGLTDRSREYGGATVEFVILLPVFLALFLSCFEASLLLTRQVMLERGVDMATRGIRLDSQSTVSQNAMRNAICDQAQILPDCRQNLLVEMQEISRTTYALPNAAQPCVNRETSITPAASWETNRASKLILLRACFAVDPFMPGAGLGTQLVSDVDGTSLRMVAATAFVVEPV